MSSRELILNTIRANRPELVELPDIHAQPFVQYDDPHQQFSSLIETLGGAVVYANEGQSVMDVVKAHWPDVGQGRIVNLLDDSNGEQSQSTSPHDHQNVDIAIVAGHLAVAENASVWVSNANLDCRSLYFLCQRLVMVVPRDRIVHNMRDAYAQIHIEERGFGSFIAGSSRTADIEQSLVMGAHGAMASLVVFV